MPVSIEARIVADRAAKEEKEKAKLAMMRLADDAEKVFGTPEGNRIARHLVPPNGYLWGGIKVNTGNSGIYYNAALLDREQELMDFFGRFCPSAFAAVCQARLEFLQTTIKKGVEKCLTPR